VDTPAAPDKAHSVRYRKHIIMGRPVFERSKMDSKRWSRRRRAFGDQRNPAILNFPTIRICASAARKGKLIQYKAGARRGDRPLNRSIITTNVGPPGSISRRPGSDSPAVEGSYGCNGSGKWRTRFSGRVPNSFWNVMRQQGSDHDVFAALEQWVGPKGVRRKDHRRVTVCGDAAKR